MKRWWSDRSRWTQVAIGLLAFVVVLTVVGNLLFSNPKQDAINACQDQVRAQLPSGHAFTTPARVIEIEAAWVVIGNAEGTGYRCAVDKQTKVVSGVTVG